ncbi:TIGR00730 family Rossman fold protein [Streptomyces flaveolus]|uniref:LOG family protein n=1 Tax=Streptomyces flaveolus TaxID=67297 RepID=UPI00342DF372
MDIAVFCSSRPVDERYTRPAAELARLLGAAGHTLVWGGSRAGLMGVVADYVKAAGGRLIGINVEWLEQYASEDADELVMTSNLADRKAQLLSRADAVVVLAGGVGTLDEVTEVVELKKHTLHNKPVVVLDSDGFYDGLRTQLERMESEGFLHRPLSELITFTTTAQESLTHITRPPVQAPLQVLPPVVA